MRYSFSLSDINYNEFTLGNINFEVELSTEEVKDQIEMFKSIFQELPNMIEAYTAAKANPTPETARPETHNYDIQ